MTKMDHIFDIFYGTVRLIISGLAGYNFIHFLTAYILGMPSSLLNILISGFILVYIQDTYTVKKKDIND